MPLRLFVLVGGPSLLVGASGLAILIRVLLEPRNASTVTLRALGVFLLALGGGVFYLLLKIFLVSNRRR